MRVSKWGNSLAVRLPAATAKNLNLKEGDEVEMVSGPRRKVTVVVTARKHEGLQRLREFSKRHPMPPDFKFNREEINAR